MKLAIAIILASVLAGCAGRKYYVSQPDQFGNQLTVQLTKKEFMKWWKEVHGHDFHGFE